MTKYFPKIRKTNFSSDSGVNLVAAIVNDNLEWIFRKNHNEHDFGIDGYIDIVSGKGNVTGQSFAVQIKSGKSYFKQKSPNGFVYYGESKHLNYYRNHQIPVLLIICDPKKNICLFEVFDENSIEPTNDNWKLNIPHKNTFDYKSKDLLTGLLPPLKEDINDVQSHWSNNSLLEESGLIFYAIEREDIESKNVKYFLQFLDRLCINDSLCRKVQGKLEIMIDGYNNDRRELYEISAVRKWFKKADKKKVPWFFFCNTGEYSYGLRMYFLSSNKTKIINSEDRLTAAEIIKAKEAYEDLPKLRVEYDSQLSQVILDKNWLRLNEITDHLGLSESVNKSITYSVMKLLRPEMKDKLKEIFEN